MKNFIGLDGEMTSSDLASGGALIQLGLSAFISGEVKSISFGINPYWAGDDIDWSEEAAAVHGISRELVHSFDPPELVDLGLFAWMKNTIGATPAKRRDNIPVGFNVGAFDMPFVQKFLPNTFSLFSRRTVDLNALCFALDGKIQNGMPIKFDTWKKRAKIYAIEKIGYENQHDAGWDAMMHLYSFEYLRDIATGV
jgi:hypothetical protein